MPKITQPILVTPLFAKHEKKKKVKLIDTDRFTAGCAFNGKPSSVEIKFIDAVDYIDFTAQNAGFTNIISLSGMGIVVPDIRENFPPGDAITYRYMLPERQSGELVVTSAGGEGKFTLFNISGYRIGE